MFISLHQTRTTEEEEESNWYGIISVDTLADYETVKKHYKKLAFLLHRDKNKFKGAGCAFSLRIAYVQKSKNRIDPRTNVNRE
ncbi:hypothetical protein EUTSA_v10011988mg [Eutrema salsugineum]|uniref:J domain-containing protein n=1 Tax=Eutrema salsugineum TaxID=72664 RepID=V4MH18_EUTSA|nr:hypothetical protein EUTSA_v10011988mg [Eutrema salsugineum]